MSDGDRVSAAAAFELLRARLLAKDVDPDAELAIDVLQEALATLAARVASGTARSALTSRMSAVGLLAAGIADELRGALDESHRQLREIVDDLDRQAAHARGPISISHHEVAVLRTRVADAFLATGRAFRFGEDLRRLAVPIAAEPTEVDVNTLVEAALNMVTPRLRRGADIFVDYSFLPNVRAWPDRLGLAVAHVLLNAVDAVAARGGIQVQTRVEPPAAIGGVESVVVSIVDTGTGIAPEILAQVFEPGFTTGPGAGLGLAIVRDTVGEIGGAIEIDSTLGAGTAVRLILPVSTSSNS